MSRWRSARPSASGASYSTVTRKQSPKPTWYMRTRTPTGVRPHHASPELVGCCAARRTPGRGPRRSRSRGAVGRRRPVRARWSSRRFWRRQSSRRLVDVQLQPPELVEDRGAAAEQLHRRVGIDLGGELASPDSRVNSRRSCRPAARRRPPTPARRGRRARSAESAAPTRPPCSSRLDAERARFSQRKRYTSSPVAAECRRS